MATVSYRRFSACVLGLVAIVVTASGCGGGNQKVTINGTVSYKGQRVSGGMLQFSGPKGGAPAAATIQQDGTFIITDVVPGEVKVSIAATPPPGGKTRSAPKVTSADLPEKYRDPEKSGLKYTITPDTRQLDVEIP
jgi:hypothetical protein